VARVYTTRLACGLVTIAEVFNIGPPPDPYVWDVRDISMTAEGDGNTAALGFTVTVVPGAGPSALLWEATPALLGPTYHWQGRCLLGPEDEISVASSDTIDWSLVITGYQLQLP